MSIKKTLTDLVRIPSVAPNEGKIALFLESELKKIGLKTQRQHLDKQRSVF